MPPKQSWTTSTGWSVEIWDADELSDRKGFEESAGLSYRERLAQAESLRRMCYGDTYDSSRVSGPYQLLEHS
jgi:hypothetical protein